MPSFPVVAIGGSAGALDPLLDLVAHLPPDFPAAVLVVVHVSPDHPSHLPELLDRASPLPARHARHDEPLEPGRIFVAPPDHHLLVDRGRARLSRGPRENRSRPSIDVLMRSVAFVCGANATGVLLSGMLDDGTSGMWAIKQLGGHAIVQHPEEAAYPSMPLGAIRQVNVDEILPVRKIPQALSRRVAPRPPEGDVTVNDEDRRRLEIEVGIAAQDNAFEAGVLNLGRLSPFTCPECHGVMVDVREGPIRRFRCHTGHAYSAPALLGELRSSVEAGLWSAVRALEEDVMLLEHLAKHFDEAGEAGEAAAYREEARESLARARRVRQDALRVGQIGQDRLLGLRPPNDANDPGADDTNPDDADDA